MTSDAQIWRLSDGQKKKTLIKFNLYHLKSFNDLDSSIAQKVLSIATPKIKKM